MKLISQFILSSIQNYDVFPFDTNSAYHFQFNAYF